MHLARLDVGLPVVPLTEPEPAGFVAALDPEAFTSRPADLAGNGPQETVGPPAHDG